jgi:hypothetical protein
MLPKIVLGVALVLAGAGWAFIGTKANPSCCTPGAACCPDGACCNADCCYPGAVCCADGTCCTDCCAAGGPCCPDGDCCAATKTVTVKKSCGNCCER